ncbi:hypothetical protein [Nocardia africana]
MTHPIVCPEIQHLDHEPMCSNPYHEPRRADVWVNRHGCDEWLWCDGCWTVWRDVLTEAFASGKLADGKWSFDRRCRACNVTFRTFDDFCQGKSL